MITQCKFNILNYKKMREISANGNSNKKTINDDGALWNHDEYPPEELIPVLKSCLDLNFSYQK